MVYYRKDGYLQAPVTMSGFDVKQVMNRLAELEDEQEALKKLKDRAEPVEPVVEVLQKVKCRRCPKCGRTLFKDKFCGDCGQAVKL